MQPIASIKTVLKDTFTVSGNPMPWKNVAATLAAVGAPPLVCLLLLGRTGVVALIASLPAHLASKDAGTAIAGLIVLATGLAGFVSLGQPDMALLVTPCLAAATAIAGGFGRARPVVRALIPWAIFTSPLLPMHEPETLFVVYIGAMIWSLFVTRLCGLAETLPPEEAESTDYAAVFGVIFAIGLTVSVYIGQHHFGRHGFWMPLSFVALCLPPHGALFSRTVQRVVGTVIGTLVIFAAGSLAPGSWWLAGLGVVSLPLAFRLIPMSYTAFITLLTVAILAFLNLVSSLDTLAFQRVAAMAAAAALTGALAAVGGLVLYLWKPEAFRALQGN
ncbi:FUSC family protein [Jiella sp. M17.18]|uniref:FUSC family protein n=1 Tax=Jiella sp. M17.18 TaxID=3234247 RepID=UPI0034DE1605